MNTADGQLRLDVGGEALVCRVLRARRRTYALRLAPDGALELRVPQRLPARLWPDILHRHRRWIAGQLQRRGVAAAVGGDFTPGSAQRYLGEHYPLQLTAGRRHVCLQDGRLQLSVPNPDDAAAVSQALDGWYRAQALALLPARLTALAATLPWLRGQTPQARVARMRSRWGSCAASGRITLNVGLVLLTPALIDYVLLHELCHLRQMNHGPRFYALLAAALPDHRQRQATLRGERPWQPSDSHHEPRQTAGGAVI